MDKIYIRFGEIPINEKSKKGNGCSGDGHKWIGYENGVSVWDAVKLNDGYHLVAPNKPNSYTYGDFSIYAFPDFSLGINKETKIYVVTGNEIGKGSDNEPLIINIKIIKQLPYNYFSNQDIRKKGGQ